MIRSVLSKVAGLFKSKRRASSPRNTIKRTASDTGWYGAWRKDRFTSARIRARMSVEDVAKEIGVSTSVIYRALKAPAKHKHVEQKLEAFTMRWLTEALP